MGLLDLLWKSYQGMQEERESNSYEGDDDNSSDLPYGYVRIQWSGWYNAVDGNVYQCPGVERICRIDEAQRIVNDWNFTELWLRQAIPGFMHINQYNWHTRAKIIE